MKYSIWVIPPNPLKNQLTKKIEQLAYEFKGPTFEPHMTILGNIDMELSQLKTKVKLIAHTTPVLKLSLGPISFSTTYFQNVLVRVNSTAELMQLNLDLKNAFKLPNDVFMPHISLLYGDHDMEIRKKATLSIDPIQSSFDVTELIITPSTPDPSEWVHAATLSFKN